MARRISDRQLKCLYWPRWRAAEKVLTGSGHLSKEEAEEKRKEIHAAVLGAPCSSKDLPANRLDDILKKFAAIASPGDGKRQAHHADQPMARVRWRIGEIQKRMNLSSDYVDAMARRLCRRSLIDCDESGLRDVLAALVIHEKRQSGGLQPPREGTPAQN